MRRVEQRMAPAPAAVLELMTGARVSRAIYAACSGCSRAEVFSLPMATICSGLTPLVNALRADAPASVRGIVLCFGHPNHWEHWGYLRYSVQTGQPSVDALRGKPIFEWLTTSRDSPPSSTRA